MTLFFALVMVIGGLGFKIACVPFHFWAPDVYEGAPTPVTAFFTVAPKAAGFAILTRFLVTLLSSPGTGEGFWTFLGGIDWPLLVAILAAGTMTIGNLGAVRQTNMKRLLAYSSIAHVGFILMAVSALSPAGIHAINVYMLAYLIMNLGAFFVVILIQERTGSVDLADYSGIAQEAPWLTGAMVIFLYSLTGLPPSVGFLGKYYVFAEVIRQHNWWLAGVGAVNSVIALYYYFRIAKAMVFGAAIEHTSSRSISQLATGLTVALAAVTLAFGIPWGAVEQVTSYSSTLFLGR
jgi:NADH-quinone oxidoreductase subunit N